MHKWQQDMLVNPFKTVSLEISSLVHDSALKPCDTQGRRYEITNESLLMR